MKSEHNKYCLMNRTSDIICNILFLFFLFLTVATIEESKTNENKLLLKDHNVINNYK